MLPKTDLRRWYIAAIVLAIILIFFFLNQAYVYLYETRSQEKEAKEKNHYKKNAKMWEEKPYGNAP